MLDEDLTAWIAFLKTMPRSVRRALRRMIAEGGKARNRVTDALELEVFPEAPWTNLDAEGNPPKEWSEK